MLRDKEAFKKMYIEKFEETTGMGISEGTDQDKYHALAALVRDEIMPYWVDSNVEYKDTDKKQVYYFSIEYLLGKMLRSYLYSLGIEEIVEEGLKDLGIDLKRIELREKDAGLGNGGLGRLAACFLDSMSYRNIAGHGCGIRYKYGLFEQKIIDGHQVEIPDNWLKYDNKWEVKKTSKQILVKFYGNIRVEEKNGRLEFIHDNYEPVVAVPYDLPIVGKHYKVNTLRLLGSEPYISDNDLSDLDRAAYLKSIEYRRSVEAISEILYPNDHNYEGKILRLKQQYFLCAAGLGSIVRTYKKKKLPFSSMADYIAIHINDTHPVVGIPELMRILMDEEGLNWEDAWNLTTKIMSFTNHTTLPEALEVWPEEMFSSLLPRIYMIIQEIDRIFVEELKDKFPDNLEKIKRMRIIDDGEIRMANLAVVASHSVNGVAKLHTKILKNNLMKDFFEIMPHKFNNKTNGVSHRRFLIKSNPPLAKLIDEEAGPQWRDEPRLMVDLLKNIDDDNYRSKFLEIKRKNKEHLSNQIFHCCGTKVDPDSIFDIQVKRIHAYKRQLLNAFHIMDLYLRLKDNPDLDISPRTFIIGGKAAPNYYFAKKVIRLINQIAWRVNNDKDIKGKIKIVFVENFNVSKGELIYPACDISEQISTATKEASGTGNMKFMMNGGITLGTLDGANIEILEQVGPENIFIFGLTPEEVLRYHKFGGYNAWEEYQKNDSLKRIIEYCSNYCFDQGSNEFRDIYDALLHRNDEFFVLKDFDSYVTAQNQISEKYKNKNRWSKMMINNIAKSFYFSSDRTIDEYARGIWGL